MDECHPQSVKCGHQDQHFLMSPHTTSSSCCYIYVYVYTINIYISAECRADVRVVCAVEKTAVYTTHNAVRHIVNAQ